ncbi:MAG TPA: DUF4124 domain-containing protein, partial [Plasticicumulans sp.]|nr:DUF4124 domain-containing protein [Plasticicumulans sp.]
MSVRMMALALIVALGPALPAAAAPPMMKWQDEQGRWHYGDRPPQAGARADALLETGQDAAAAKEYETWAKMGDARAQTKLGELYLEGRGVSRDEAKARELFGIAAGNGYAEARFRLGDLLATGRGGALDLPGAVRWYR